MKTKRDKFSKLTLVIFNHPNNFKKLIKSMLI
jgi:hypothetical protein